MAEIKVIIPLGTSEEQRVACDVLAVCEQMIAARPPLGEKPFIVRKSSDGKPRACVNGLPDEYQINVTCLGGNRWNQLAFQLGHEIGHFYINPLYTNWFIESVCTAISFLCLDALADKWKTSPLRWKKEYAPKFSNYRLQHVRDAQTKVNNAQCIPTWFRTSLPNIIKIDRNAQALCAEQIAIIICAYIGCCSAITWLGCASHSASPTILDIFEVWRQKISSRETGLVDGLTAIFPNIAVQTTSFCL